MELIKDVWSAQDGEEFVKYIVTLGNPARTEWTQRILNTQMPVLAIPSPIINSTVKQLSKGNFESFLQLGLKNYFENVQINGALIMQIKDFDKKIKMLKVFTSEVDSWASTDALKIPLTKKNEELWWAASADFCKSEIPFSRRFGINILFPFVKSDKYYSKIYAILDSFENETEYYVNMVNAWLIAELFTHRREDTLKYFENNKLNKFTCNKAISKCRDSFRISKEDKDLLLSFRK